MEQCLSLVMFVNFLTWITLDFLFSLKLINISYRLVHFKIDVMIRYLIFLKISILIFMFDAEYKATILKTKY